MAIRELKEYRIKLGFAVEALDEQQAQEIARDLLNHAQIGILWKTLDAYVDTIEEA